MKKNYVKIAILSALLVLFVAMGGSVGGAAPRRIVSLVPSVTENLFALGVGERVVGVTAWCDYPAQAAEKR